VTYQAQDDLAQDGPFQARVRACAIEQAAQTYAGVADQAQAAYADAVLRLEGPELFTMYSLAAASPGLADQPDQITDAEILSTVQAFWPTAAAAHYMPDGGPKTGTY